MKLKDLFKDLEVLNKYMYDGDLVITMHDKQGFDCLIDSQDALYGTKDYKVMTKALRKQFILDIAAAVLNQELEQIGQREFVVRVHLDFMDKEYQDREYHFKMHTDWH